MRRILVVEDAPLNREAVSRLLKAAGYDVVVAANGAEALARLKEKPADLIVLDQMMPEVDGLTFLSGIRRFPKWKSLPVIMYTALKDKQSATRAEGLGVVEYHVKTELTGEQLVALVQKHVEGELAGSAN
jgi:CheY-like chemotaxis protein